MSAGFKRAVSILTVLLLCMTGCGGNPEQPAADGTEGMQTPGGADSIQTPSVESGIPSAAENDEQEERKGSYILEEVDLPNPELGLAELRGEGGESDSLLILSDSGRNSLS